jgi:hypothetical protein
MSFIVFAQIPLLGYSIYIVLLRKGYPAGLGAAILVLGFLWTLGFFSCFSSPHAGGISEAVPQNEVEGIKWLVESKAAYPYVLSSGEKVGYTFLGNSSSNQAQFKISSKYSASPGSDKPFYLIVTTFSEAMGLEKLAESETDYSAENGTEPQKGKPIYKIYDSLDIKIYQNTP